MNVELLKAAYRDSPAVQAICDHLASRSNNQTETKLHRIIHHLQSEAYEFKRGEIIAAFRKLEEAGVGKYVEGRRGWPSRFVWEAKSLYISAIAADGEAAVAEATSEHFSEEEDVDLIEHSFVLRPELSVAIDLPSNFTAQEASRLAAFIQALPFTEG